MSETVEVTTTNSAFSSILSENQNVMSRIEAFKDQTFDTGRRNIAFAGMAVAGLFVAGMFALQILSGVATVVLLGATALGSVYGIRYVKAMDPVIREKWKNKALKLMIQNARKDAIYQLDNHVLENTRRLKAAREARDAMGAHVEMLAAKLKDSDPNADSYAKKKDMYNRVNAAYMIRKKVIRQGYLDNEAFEAKVKDYKDLDAFSKIHDEAMSFLQDDGMDLRELLSLEAFAAIEENFNKSLVSIENNAEDMELELEIKNEEALS